MGILDAPVSLFCIWIYFTNFVHKSNVTSNKYKTHIDVELCNRIMYKHFSISIWY